MPCNTEFFCTPFEWILIRSDQDLLLHNTIQIQCNPLLKVIKSDQVNEQLRRVPNQHVSQQGCLWHWHKEHFLGQNICATIGCTGPNTNSWRHPWKGIRTNCIQQLLTHGCTLLLLACQMLCGWKHLIPAQRHLGFLDFRMVRFHKNSLEM